MTDVATRLGWSGSDTAPLVAYLRRQRWYAGPDEPVAVDLIDLVPVPGPDATKIAIIGLGSEAGHRDYYQVLLGTGRSGSDIDLTLAESPMHDASASPDLARTLAGAPAEGTTLPGADGTLELRSIGPRHDAQAGVRLLGADQSNTSVVLDDSMLLKIYRRLEAGLNPELEMLLFLTERGFAHVPQATGWYSYTGAQMNTTLGVAQRFLPDARDGWVLGVEEVPNRTERYLGRVERLGTVIAEMHRTLADGGDDPAFAPEEPTPETAALLSATIDEQIEDLFTWLPDDQRCSEIVGRADQLRELGRELAGSGTTSLLVRTHGDLHLGQVLWSDGDWYVTDFEGEPDRTLAERRSKAYALRDVAGMLRSFAYLAFVVAREGTGADDFEAQARERFLGAYRSALQGSPILPSSEPVQDRLLALFALEKLVYELRYELRHRPDWVEVPLAGLRRVLDRDGS
jgi:trehalose synthase-fused probable maltokinase